MALNYLQNTDSLPATEPQLILTDSLIGFLYEQIQDPDFSFGPYLNRAPTTHNNVETTPESVGSCLNLVPTTHNSAETTPRPVNSYFNLAPTTQNNADNTPELVNSYLNLAPATHNNAEKRQDPTGSYLNLVPAPTTSNNAETRPDPVASYLNLVPTTHNTTETKTDPVGSYLNLGPTTHYNAETKPDPVGSFLNPVLTTHSNAETKPESVGVYLNPLPTTYNNAEPKPDTAQVLTPNSFPVTAPCIHSQYQDSYCMNAQNVCHTKAEVTPSQFAQNHQVCNNHFGTASLTNQVKILYQNTGFPVMPCTGNEQGMMVPAFKSETGLPVMPCTGQMQGVMMPAFKPASTQTVAARVRRKKISDRTQELAKLIPGGSSMNTADMLLAAFKYVNFLKAQIGILTMMDSEEAREVPIMVKEYMRELLGSTNVQKYLSANGKCLVPNKLAMNLNKEMESNNVVSRDLSRFVESINNQDDVLT